MRGCIYLDNAATSLPAPEVLEAAAEFTELLGDRNSSASLIKAQTQILVQARETAAEFLNCDVQEIALVRSTSQALGTIAGCLPLERGDNVLICDLEYQASTACWHPRAEREGIELRCVETTDGRITAEDFKKCIDERTKVILLAAVQEINGFRADIKEIGRLAKERQCYFLVDGIQEAGALQVNVKDLGVDFYCAGGKKWIGNPFGCGFLYVRKELLSQIQPPYYSYLDIKVPEKYYVGENCSHVQAYLRYLESPERHPFDELAFSRTAEVFEAGGYANYIGALGLSKALDVLRRQGMDKVEQRVLALSKKLISGLKSMGFSVTSPEENENRSGIVSFSLHDLRDCRVDEERALVQYLKDRQIQVSLRCTAGTGGIRVSPHYYTPESYIDTFLETVNQWLRERE